MILMFDITAGKDKIQELLALFNYMNDNGVKFKVNTLETKQKILTVELHDDDLVKLVMVNGAVHALQGDVVVSGD